MTAIKEHTELLGKLRQIDRQGYKRYKELKGAYRFPGFTLFIDHVQGDPFAAPTRVCTVIPVKGRIPEEFLGSEPELTAVEDFLGRRFKEIKRSLVKGKRGIGKSGIIDIDAGTQKVLKRNAVVITGDRVEFRFVMGLPAAGRTILGKEAAAMFTTEITEIVQRTMQIPREALTRFVHSVKDQATLREVLSERGLVAFVADDALLPRRSGVDDRPLTEGLPFKSPPSMRVTLSTPHSGEVTGMGIPKGVTLIVGGGFHGKSTLLNALQMGIYNHIPGDGRERVVTLPEAVKVRAADGRYIEKVDISPFIHDLPFGKDTRAFSTDNASGSTSQAAGIMEALEAGCRLLLMDEDTSATNFMIRDERMQHLVPREKEPITPLVDKVRQLYTEHGVSTILVMGGSGDYFDVADTVIMMDTYEPRDVTAEVREIIRHFPTRRAKEGGDSFGTLRHRIPLKSSFDPSRGKRDVKIDAKGLHTILFGHTPIDLKDMEQLVDISQTRSIGYLVHYASQRYLDRTMPLSEILDRVFDDLAQGGLDILLPTRVGNLAMPRKLDVAQAINRMRSLRIAS
ncbi:MAG: ABC-ATPase domain-containing protein [Deltaproteobacteria bacterium]|nr:ABC-ATPase domain-containing protein [Deltaproteobacteria bacterium]